MPDDRLAASVRLLRIRRSWSQANLARIALVSQSTVSRLERGHADSLSIAVARRVAGALDVRLDLVPRWRGGDLERTLNAVHNELHEIVARRFEEHPGWTARPEVSFSQFGERGVIDLLAWHREKRMLLVVELKSDLVDPGGLIGQVDRYRRLAPVVARGVGWIPRATSCWVVVTDTPANRNRLGAHRTLLRGRFPADGRSMPGWLADPREQIETLSFAAVHGRGRHLDRAAAPSRGRSDPPLPEGVSTAAGAPSPDDPARSPATRTGLRRPGPRSG